MRALFATAVAICLAATPGAAQDFYLGEVRSFGFNYCPRGWAPADGAVLSIAEHKALFSLLSTAYGGDGRDTFALPDLRGRSVVGQGAGSALPAYRLGDQGESPRAGVRPAQSGFVAVTTCISVIGVFPPRR